MAVQLIRGVEWVEILCSTCQPCTCWKAWVREALLKHSKDHPGSRNTGIYVYLLYKTRCFPGTGFKSEPSLCPPTQ
jgi:hypothetical protein